MKLICNGDEEQLCGHGDMYMTYFCFYNKMSVAVRQWIPPTYISIIIVYQVMQDIGKSLMVKDLFRYIGISTPAKPLLISTISFNVTHSNGPIWLYRYTVRTYYGYGIIGAVFFQQVHTSDTVVVNIYDGPFLLRSYNHHASRGDTFIAGYLALFLIKVPNRSTNSTIQMVYRKQRHTYTYHKFTDVGEAYNISVNTIETHERTSFYYKYIAVAVDDGFIKLTMRNIRTLSGGSYTCEYGGFAISDLWIHHINVNGPYCTQYGSEPLVNDIRTFYSAKNYLTFLVYSYTFQLDIDISFETTACEGITNVCNLVCWGRGFLNKRPSNYEIIQGDNPDICRLTILLRRRCIILQRTSTEKSNECWFNILAEGGFMNTTLQTQNDFR